MKSILAFAFCLLTMSGFSQIFVIQDGTVNGCAGVFVDDGNDPVSGEGAPYTPGNSYTFTICPDVPGDVISIDFVAFALFTSPNPNNSDYLYIFDGDSDAAPSMGSYTGNDLQGLPVTGTVNNDTGCLTFVFVSNPNGSGTFPGWEGLIECTTPCATPTSASEILDPEPQGAEQSVGVCLGAELTFGDAGSFAEPGFNLEYYIWDFDDGTIDTLETPADVTHTYSEPGEYLVSLAVVDNNGCRSLNLDPLQVLVSTIPIFNTDFESPVCLDEINTIDASPIQSVTWTALPPQVAAGETYLADGAGFSYSSTLTFDFFEAGATLDDCSDLLDVFINMEHSYLGDLQMSITCPDGTNVILLEYPNGGGNTYLGEAIDNGGTDPGIGYDYAWAPDATNGNLPDATTVPVGGVTPGNSVPSGTYQSDYDMCDLVGCPLNGDWTFNVVDNLAIDNGYIFAWGINFNPTLFPDITTFTPVIGLQSDSSWWEGPNIVSTSADGNILEVTYDTPGFYEYTYYATNNFGCTFDTTIVVEAMEGPEITAGPDLTYCEDPVQLQAGLVGEPLPECSNDAGTYSYCWENNENLELTFCPDNPGDGITMMQIEFISGQQDFFDFVTFYNGDNTGAPFLSSPWTSDLAGTVVVADNATGCITFLFQPDGTGSCEDGTYPEMEIVVSCVAADDGMVWSWEPPTGLSATNVQNPMAEVNQATVYTVTAYPEGFPGCIITDQVVVAPDALADPGLTTDSTLCYNSPISFLIDYLDGNPAPGGVWTDGAGNVVPDVFNPSEYPDGLNTTYTYTVGNGTCEGQSELTLDVLEATNANCCQTNAVAGDDAFPCELTYQLQAEPALGLGTWTGPEGVSFSDIHDPNAIASMASPGGVVTLTWTDDNGFLCSEFDEVNVTFSDPVSLIVVPEDALCYNQNSGTAVGVPSGGTPTNGQYVFDWEENGYPGIIPQTRDSLPAGTYQVKVTDSVGCTDSTLYTIGEPNPQEIFITQAPPRCAEECSGRIGIRSLGAVDYSFDGGMTWVPDSVSFVCAGDFDVIARNANGCEISQPVSLIDPPEFVADFNINPLPTTVKNTRITFQDISSPGPIYSSHFVFGEYPALGEAHDRISVFEFPKDTAGIYPVTLFTTSVNGCTDTTTKEVIIHDDLIWYIPNSFSPNEDGINDIWRPVGNTLDIRDYEVTIMDRWGRQVFKSNDYDEGWNGSSNKGDGEHYLDTGIYTYLIKVSSATTEEKREITGFITLVR